MNNHVDPAVVLIPRYFVSPPLSKDGARDNLQRVPLGVSTGYGND